MTIIERGAITLAIAIMLAHAAMTIGRKLVPPGENRYLDNTTINVER